jgi:hypothetical protein
MKTKLTTAKNIVLAGIFGVLIGFVVWNINRVSAYTDSDRALHHNDFGIVILLPASQNARLNFVRVEPDDSGVEDPNMQPCIVEVRTFNANGRAYGTPDTFELRPGVAVSRNVIPAGSTTIEGTFQFRATFRVIDDPNIRNRCEVIPTMEVYSRETGGTLFMYPAARGFNPQPDPPGLN